MQTTGVCWMEFLNMEFEFLRSDFLINWTESVDEKICADTNLTFDLQLIKRLFLLD